MFLLKSEIEFAVVAIYVDDLNLIGIFEELSKTTSSYKKKEFKIKDLGKKKFILAYILSICLVEYSYISQHTLKKFLSIFI